MVIRILITLLLLAGTVYADPAEDQEMAELLTETLADVADCTEFADGAIKGLDRQGVHLTGATTQTEAGLKMSEDYSTRGFFARLEALLGQVIMLLGIMVGGTVLGGAGLGVVKGVKGFGRMRAAAKALQTPLDQTPTPDPKLPAR